jgi:hypothetical protein
LQRRRDHLKNVWIWFGPVLLASGITVFALAEKALGRPGRLWNVAPFALMLALWIVLGWLMRRKQAQQIQAEIDEISDT